MTDENTIMRIKVTIEIEAKGEYLAVGSHEEIYLGEDTDNNRLAQTIVYAMPKQCVPLFDVLEMFHDRKVVGHGEIP